MESCVTSQALQNMLRELLSNVADLVYFSSATSWKMSLLCFRYFTSSKINETLAHFQGINISSREANLQTNKCSLVQMLYQKYAHREGSD